MKNPGFQTDDSPTPDNLIAGEFPRVTEAQTLITGQNLVRGSVVGAITLGAINGAPSAGNTGNGAFSGAAILAAGAKPGIYRAVCIEPGANAGKFLVISPDGRNIGVATVAVAFAAEIGFTIADGSADFVSGDAFDITVAAGSGKYKLAATAATDGSSVPAGILVDDTDATAADEAISVYVTGQFAKTALTFGAGHTAVTVADELRKKNIYLRDVLAAI